MREFPAAPDRGLRELAAAPERGLREFPAAPDRGLRTLAAALESGLRPLAATFEGSGAGVDLVGLLGAGVFLVHRFALPLITLDMTVASQKMRSAASIVRPEGGKAF